MNPYTDIGHPQLSETGTVKYAILDINCCTLVTVKKSNWDYINSHSSMDYETGRLFENDESVEEIIVTSLDIYKTGHTIFDSKEDALKVIELLESKMPDEDFRLAMFTEKVYQYYSFNLC